MVSSELGEVCANYTIMVLGGAGFSDRALNPAGKRSDGVRSEKSAGFVIVGVFGTFHLRGIGLTILLQLPNSYPCIRTS